MPLTNSKASSQYFRYFWKPDTIAYEERVYIAFLDATSWPIKCKVLYDGKHASCKINLDDVCNIREWARKYKSKNIIIAHNHPSGDTQPSDFDKTATIYLINQLREIDIELRDHLILTENSYFSFKDAGLLQDMKATG